MNDFVRSARLMVLECEYQHEMQLEAKRARSIPYEDAFGRMRLRDTRSWTTCGPRPERHDSIEHNAVNDVYEGQCELRKQPFTPVTISKEYNGRSIMDLLNDKPGWTYKEARMVIENEGGHIDDQHIIRQ